MSIGTIIKKLRREREITQEQLAEYLGITSRAVSQWECDRTAPDISQLPMLANIFEVSADVLLEIDSLKKEETISAFLAKYEELGNKGNRMEQFNLATDMYCKFPNDFRITEKYIWELFYDPNYMEEPFGEGIHKDELYKLCNKILDDCTVQKIRYTAMSIISSLYVNDGLINKAGEICEQFPESIYDTSSEQYEQLYCRCDKDKYIKYIKKNLRYTTEHLVNKIRNFGTFAAQTREDKISAYKKCIVLLDTIYDNGNYGFSSYHIGHINCLLAQLYLDMNEHMNGLAHLEKGLCFSKVYDELPKEVRHSSLLVKDDCEDMSKVSKGTQLNSVAYEINEFTKFIEGRQLPSEYTDILHKYEPFM
ncbi:MAG: helix-turn-helix transcriptional regulator [Oscillospiraceae bacterium]|jgi:transcriptional regulator with XRE-family HTH domain|nr:helix-turn-helix transcriptional regulator [Oscillospiraceae bacterium]